MIGGVRDVSPQQLVPFARAWPDASERRRWLPADRVFVPQDTRHSDSIDDVLRGCVLMSFDPVIVLVRPQLGENIGACARAMLNCGLDELRLVAPRDGWPSAKARAAATGAVEIVDRARLFENTAAAIADLELVFATTARRRDLIKPAVDLDGAAEEVTGSGLRCGFLFGPERTGLDNDDVTLATRLLHIPLDPGFQSLNLGQAVLLVSYTLFRRRTRLHVEQTASAPAEAASRSRELRAPSQDDRASSSEMLNLFHHLENELDAVSFFRVPEKRAGMVRNLRNLLQRAELRSHEVRTLHGVISALTGRRKDGTPARRPRVS